MDRLYVYAIAAVIVGLIGARVVRRDFDPFAPLWLFLAGFAQIYVVQAISYREYAVRARGIELVTQANLRALWALGWFLLVYFSGLGKWLARRLPAVPARWSPGMVGAMAPPLVVWGLLCSGLVLSGPRDEPVSAEEGLFRQFPVVMLVAGVLMIVTGRQTDRPRPGWTAAGVAVAAAYCLIWMFNGKRSHSMMAVLTGVSAYYLPRLRRPSIPVMGLTGLGCVLAVSLALGWRGNRNYEHSVAGFARYVGDFDARTMLVNLNLAERDPEAAEAEEQPSKETEEYGGFLLMLDTVPARSAYDYGASYLRLVSTYIPRLVWPDKPLFGREQWVGAWMAGSEQPRDPDFTGPAIGLLGATQLNGGATATVIVLAVIALLTRTAYDYYRYYADRPWAQAWWSLTYFNAWMLTFNDDPFVWFYYLYGHTILPPLAFLWISQKLGPGAKEVHG